MTASGEYEVYSLQADIDIHEQKIDGLDRACRSLRNDLDELTSRLEGLTSRLEGLTSNHYELDGKLTDLENERIPRLESEAEQAAADLEAGLTEVRSVVKEMHARVQWLERNVRAASGATPTDLDAADGTLRELAQRAALGRISETALLVDALRRVHEQRVETYELARRQQQDALAAALRHSAELAETSINDPAHAEAKASYRAAIERMELARTQGAQHQSAAQEAQQVLQADDEARRLHEPKIRQGRAARASLRDQLRLRVNRAVSEGALLPAWFTTALGSHPPADDTAEWIDAAVDLLAYRITYQVTDPVVALGRAPTSAEANRDSSASERFSWYHELTAKMRKQRQWP